MARISYLLLSIISALLLGCRSEPVGYHTNTVLSGTWVKAGDPSGRQPADTLFFFVKNGKNLLAFYSAGSPGPVWPSHVETEYRFEGDDLSFRDYTGTRNDFVPVISFQWLKRGESFTVKFHEILRFISADYRVTYRKIK